MPTREAIRAALETFVSGGAGEAESRLIGEALRAGRLVLAEGERSVALGGSADGTTIVTGDGNVVLSLDASAARALRALAGPPQPDVPMLLNRGIKQLRARSYQQATNTLAEVVKADPSIRMATFYLALALMKGRRPKVLNRNEIQALDELLSAVTCGNHADSLFHWFRALIRDDYYNGNGLLCPPPTVQKLVSTALAGNINVSELRELLRELPMLNNRLHMMLKTSTGQH
jgi:hypothetical protein